MIASGSSAPTAVSASTRPSSSPTTRAPTTGATPSRKPASSSAAPTRPPLIVLDSTGNPSLAQTAAARFRAGGWTVTSTAELTNDILSTVAYYDPAVPGAQSAAEQLQQQFPVIRRVVTRFAELPAGPIVVVLTSDYS